MGVNALDPGGEVDEHHESEQAMQQFEGLGSPSEESPRTWDTL